MFLRTTVKSKKFSQETIKVSFKALRLKHKFGTRFLFYLFKQRHLWFLWKLLSEFETLPLSYRHHASLSSSLGHCLYIIQFIIRLNLRILRIGIRLRNTKKHMNFSHWTESCIAVPHIEKNPLSVTDNNINFLIVPKALVWLTYNCIRYQGQGNHHNTGHVEYWWNLNI